MRSARGRVPGGYGSCAIDRKLAGVWSRSLGHTGNFVAGVIYGRWLRTCALATSQPSDVETVPSTACVLSFGVATQHTPAHFLYVSVRAGVRPRVYKSIGASAAV